MPPNQPSNNVLNPRMTIAAEIGSPMGITMKAVKATIKHAEENTGLKIPMDVEGADYMALLSSNEIALYPEYIESLAKIFDHAGVSWTLSSEAYEATNAGLQIGNKETAGIRWDMHHFTRDYGLLTLVAVRGVMFSKPPGCWMKVQASLGSTSPRHRYATQRRSLLPKTCRAPSIMPMCGMGCLVKISIS